ncbi:MAG: methyltransferase domain-containing protein [Candidatus Bathyarchaeota archaeon]
MCSNFDVFVALEAGFAPTPEEVGRRMMKSANLCKGKVLYDLGSGDGTLLIIAAEEFEARAVGVEIQGMLVTQSRNRIRNLGLKSKIKVVKGDFFKVDLGDADVVALYLTPWALKALRSKLENELKRGARVVVYKYAIEGWKPKKTVDAEDGSGENKIFLYAL